MAMHVERTTTTVVMTQPGKGALLVPKEGVREFSSGLFGCFEDCGSCLCTCLCLPCMLCKISTRQGDCLCMPYCVPAATVAMRARIRTMGGINGSICNDCLVLSCCGACAVCQMARELDYMGL